MDFILDLTRQIKNHPASRQLIKFLFVGTFCTIVSYSVFLACLRLFDFHYILANFCGFICGVTLGYNLNSRWTFDSKNSKLFHRYLIFYLSSLIVSTLLLTLIVETLEVIPEIANILTIFVITYYNFFGVKFLVFKK